MRHRIRKGDRIAGVGLDAAGHVAKDVRRAGLAEHTGRQRLPGGVDVDRDAGGDGVLPDVHCRLERRLSLRTEAVVGDVDQRAGRRGGGGASTTDGDVVLDTVRAGARQDLGLHPRQRERVAARRRAGFDRWRDRGGRRGASSSRSGGSQHAQHRRRHRCSGSQRPGPAQGVAPRHSRLRRIGACRCSFRRLRADVGFAGRHLMTRSGTSPTQPNRGPGSGGAAGRSSARSGGQPATPVTMDGAAWRGSPTNRLDK